uniref:A49-like RNA polymerase I associated factor n=1 Tax=Parastrongyloides trichosuri TaxID=131310 RepID=A0A0N4Z4H6_PARTI
MYSLKTNFPMDFTVQPADVMYRLPSYHTTQGNEICDNNEGDIYVLPEFTEAEFILRQVKLIKDICSLRTSFENFAKKNDSAPVNENKPSKDVPPTKASKKEKSPASNVKETAQVKQSLKPFEYDSSFKDSSYKQISNLKLSNPYCLPPTLIQFKEQKNVPKKDIIVEIPRENSEWFDVIDNMVKKNKLSFDVKVIKDDKITTPKASSGNIVAEGLVPVWKFLGSVLGIYSYESNVYSNMSDKFLNAFASNYQSGLDNECWRKINSFLGTYNTLSSSVEYSLVDAIAYSLHLKNKNDKASNVEIWASRFKEIL